MTVETTTGNIRIERLKGEEVQRYIHDLARLRIRIFRNFPYLYEGDEEYERRYLERYLDSPDSVLVVAFDGERVVGASTGMPMEDADEEFRRPLEDQNYEVSKIFYFAESVLKPEYRGQGIGVKFFEEREAHVRSLGRFEWSCFAAVVRSPDDPRRPSDYMPLHSFWVNRGYERKPELRTTLKWREVGHTEELPRVMEFWMKRLDEA